MSLRDYFHLTRDAFTIDPWQDASVYFGAAKPQAQIRERLETDFVSARGVPKFIVLGRYGGGKTHTLAHIRYELESGDLSHEFPADCIYLELAPVAAKERWATFHRRTLDAIGTTRAREAMQALMKTAPAGADPIATLKAKDVVRYGEEGLKASQENAFKNLLYGGRLEQLAWDWIRGDGVASSDAALLGTETALKEPSDLVNALLNVASLLYVGTGKKTVLLADEGEALGSLTHGDSIVEFTTMLRRLLENVNNVLGIVISVESEHGMGDAPRVLQDDAIQSRLEYEQGTIDLADLVPEEDDAKQFIIRVLAHLVDQDEARTEIQRQGLTMEPEFYPFGEDMVEQIAHWATEVPERQSPRQLMAVLSKAVATSWVRRNNNGASHVVNEDALRDVMFPEEMIPEQD